MIKQFVDDIDDYIRDAQQLKKFVSGPIINISLNENQIARLNGIIHALTGIKDHYIELLDELNAITIVPDGNNRLNVYYPGDGASLSLTKDEVYTGIANYYGNKTETERIE